MLGKILSDPLKHIAKVDQGRAVVHLAYGDAEQGRGRIAGHGLIKAGVRVFNDDGLFGILLKHFFCPPGGCLCYVINISTLLYELRASLLFIF